ncbi:hypothetical protein MHYP_G00132000 [Metynnis hypsauchen]
MCLKSDNVVFGGALLCGSSTAFNSADTEKRHEKPGFTSRKKGFEVAKLYRWLKIPHAICGFPLQHRAHPGKSVEEFEPSEAACLMRRKGGHCGGKALFCL